MRKRTRWLVSGVVAAGVVAIGRRSANSEKIRRTRTRLRRRVRHAAGTFEGAAYCRSGREPDPGVIDNVLADRVRSSLGRLERDLDVPRVHVMVEHHVALLHGEVGRERDADEIEHAVAAVPGVAGIESYLHVGLGRWDTRPSEGRAVQPPSAAFESLIAAAEKAGVATAAAPLVVRGVLATFADRLPKAQREHLSSNLPPDVRPLFTPPRRVRDAPPPRSLHDLVGRIVATTSGVELDRAGEVTVAVVHALRDLVPEDARGVAAVLPPELRGLWENGSG